MKIILRGENKGTPCRGCRTRTMGACLYEKCKKFDRKQARERSEQGQCVMCGSSDRMDWSDLNFDMGVVSNKATCGSCNIEYWEVYRLEALDAAAKSGDMLSVDIDEPRQFEKELVAGLKRSLEYFEAQNDEACHICPRKSLDPECDNHFCAFIKPRIFELKALLKRAEARV